METLFTYCIPYDAGSAPNPYWGLCTVAICKPKIRRIAQVGDWVVGTGSKLSPIGDISGYLVYAMKVTQKMTMEKYDQFTARELPEKIPDWRNADTRRRVGDSIYDFSTKPPTLRKSVHRDSNRETDLGGQFALLSNHFFYFGNNPVPIPENLMDIIKQGSGHRSSSNAPYLNRFIKWIDSLGYEPNVLVGQPQKNLFQRRVSR